MSSSFVIERLVPERDLDGLMEVARASFSSPWTREMFLWEIQNSDVSHVYVVRRAGRVVAFCCCWLIFDELHINNLAVHPDRRRQRLASTLLTHVLREERRQGARQAVLEVRRSNLAALALYQKLGFRVIGERLGYYANPAEDALILGHRGRAEDPVEEQEIGPGAA
jgi:[ribosomal protein S18]-alanine N-acetyltransferase